MIDSPAYSCQTTNSDDISNELLDELRNFVNEQAERDPTHPAVSNMMDRPPAGLLSNIIMKTRWTEELGSISLLRCQGQIVGISCVEHGDLHTDISVGGIRCWLDSRHRSSQLMSRYLLRSNLEWSRAKNKVGMMLTFNDYNKWIYDAIRRACHGKAAGVSRVWSNWWNDCIILPKQLQVKYTNQWCVIKPIVPAAAGAIAKEICK